MVGVYKSLTDFLPMLEEDKIGDWMIDRVNDGTPVWWWSGKRISPSHTK